MYPVWAGQEAPCERLAEEQPALENDSINLLPEDIQPEIGRNCRLGIADKNEILRLNEELEDLKRWFEDYGQNGILFPNSVINAFAQETLRQAA